MNSSIRRVALIMAGGAGERFWPVSRETRPKQLLTLPGAEKSFLAESIDRIQPLVQVEDIYILTSATLAPILKTTALPIPPENILAEPCRRNTAGALVFAAAQLQARYPDGEDLLIAVLTADQYIGDVADFQATVERLWAHVAVKPALGVMGMQPTYPATGFGYIQTPAHRDAEEREALLPVLRFHEKPDAATAEDYVNSGAYLWNGGMFFWRLSVFLTALEQAAPAYAQSAQKMASALQSGDEAVALAIFEALDSAPIDKVLMEKAEQVIVAPAHFPWDDAGSWNYLERCCEADAAGNITQGAPIIHDCHNSIVVNDAGPEAMAVGVIGVENLVVVVTKDAVLVAPKDRAEEIRLITQTLKEGGAPQV